MQQLIFIPYWSDIVFQTSKTCGKNHDHMHVHVPEQQNVKKCFDGPSHFTNMNKNVGNITQRIMDINESLCKSGFFLLVDIISSGLSIVYIKGSLFSKLQGKRELWMICERKAGPHKTLAKKMGATSQQCYNGFHGISVHIITVFQCKCETGSRPKYSKTYVKRPLKNRQNKYLNNNW